MKKFVLPLSLTLALVGCSVSPLSLTLHQLLLQPRTLACAAAPRALAEPLRD